MLPLVQLISVKYIYLGDQVNKNKRKRFGPLGSLFNPFFILWILDIIYYILYIGPVYNTLVIINTINYTLYWTVSELSLDCLWTVSDCLWTISGLSLKCLWTISGLFLDCIWTVSYQPVTYRVCINIGALHQTCKRFKNFCDWVSFGLEIFDQWNAMRNSERHR